jgi:hypothetical protein
VRRRQVVSARSAGPSMTAPRPVGVSVPGARSRQQRAERAAADGERGDVVGGTSWVARSQIRSRIASIW